MIPQQLNFQKLILKMGDKIYQEEGYTLTALSKNINLLPLMLMVLIGLKSFYEYYTTDFEYGIEQYLCFVLLFIAVLLYLLRKLTLATHLTFVILILSTFDLLRYSLITKKITFGVSINSYDLSLSIQPRSFLFLVLFLILNKDYMFSLLKRMKKKSIID